MKASPTQRSLAMLRNEGYECAIVEKWNPHAKIRQDLFGFIDILAMQCYARGLVGVQTTTQTNMPARMRKALASPHLKAWLTSGNIFWVHGWSKKGGRFQVKRRRVVFKKERFYVEDEEGAPWALFDALDRGPTIKHSLQVERGE